MHVLIVGNSAAGLAAAGSVRRLDNGAGITIISGESYDAYARCLLPEVLSGARDVQGITYPGLNFYHKNDIKLRLGVRVVSIEPVKCRVHLDNGETMGYDRLLLATGANSVKPSGPGAGLKGIFTLRSYQDVRDMATAADEAGQAVILGGGLVSLKAAAALRRRGVTNITVIVRSNHLLTRQLDEQSARLIENELAGEGIEFIFGAGHVAFLEQSGRGRVGAVALDNGREIPAGLVLVGKGVLPNDDLLKSAGGDTGYGIKVNEYLETSLPGIYAAGDCIEVTDRVTGEKTSSALWPLAVEQGRCAGYNIMGLKRCYPPPLTRLNSAQFGRVPFVSVGDTKGEGEGEVFIFNESGNYRRLIFYQDRLAGMIMAGRVEGAGVYTALIKKGSRINYGLKKKLLAGTVSAADIIKI